MAKTIASEAQGESMITVGGKPRVFRLTRRAMQEFKTITGKTVLQAAAEIGETQDLDPMFDLVYVGLAAADAEYTQEKFNDEVTLPELIAFVRQLSELIGTAYGPEKNPTGGETESP